MPNLNPPTEQPPSAPEAQPPSAEAQSVDWQKETERLKRSYDGLQGQFTKIKSERDEYAGQVKDLTSDYEGQIASLKAERAQLLEAATQFETKYRDVETKLKSSSAELSVLREYPDLAEDLKVGALRIDGLEGEALENYVKTYAGRVAASGRQEVGRRIEGASPPAPHQPTTNPVSFQDAATGVEVARKKYGTNSKEYDDAMSTYLRVIQSGQHRS